MLNLSMVDPYLHTQARRAFEEGKAAEFVCYTDSQTALALVVDNLHALQRQGIYEAALLFAFTGTRTNHSNWSDGVLGSLFALADKAKLRAAGEQIPRESVVVYRGISGYGPRRRKRGWSWTDSLDVACWFALRFNLANPAVLSATVQPAEILARVNDGREREFVVRPTTVTTLRLSRIEIAEQAERHKQAVAGK
jgi:hypothetical protein